MSRHQMGMNGLGQIPTHGPEPSGWPAYGQRMELPRRAGIGPVGPGPGTIAQQLELGPIGAASDPGLLETLRLASHMLVWNQHPSPLETKPLLGTREFKFARFVLGPPTDIAVANATTGATEMAAAEGALSGQTVSVLTPATSSQFVEVLTFTPPAGRAFLIYSCGSWGHDYLSNREMIKWRVRVGSTLVVDERELGILGALDRPVIVQELATERNQIVVEARNLDGASGSLVDFAVIGWSFPIKGTGLSWDDLVNDLPYSAQELVVQQQQQAAQQADAMAQTIVQINQPAAPDPGYYWVQAPWGEVFGQAMQYNPRTGQMLPSRTVPWEVNTYTGEAR